MGFNDNQYDPALFCSRCCAESGVEDDGKTRAVLLQEIESLKGDNTRLKRWRDNLLESLRNGCRLEWTVRGGFRSFPDNLQAKVNELEKLREGDSELIRALAKDAGIEITAPDTSPGTQWEQFHAGVTDLKECWNNQRKTIVDNYKTIKELEERAEKADFYRAGFYEQKNRADSWQKQCVENNTRAETAESDLNFYRALMDSAQKQEAREIGRLQRVGRKALELLKQFAGMGFVKAQHLTIEIEEALKLAIKTEEALK